MRVIQAVKPKILSRKNLNTKTLNGIRYGLETNELNMSSTVFPTNFSLERDLIKRRHGTVLYNAW